MACLVFSLGSQQICSGQIKRIGDFSYTNSPTEAFITMYDGPTSNRVTVPEFIEGKPVVRVGDAFKYSEVLEVVFPSNLNAISFQSFLQCSFLTNLVIPTKVRTIEGSAFAECSSLQNIQFLSEAPESLGSSAFAGCVQLRSIRVPTNVTALNARLFSGCTSLTNVSIRAPLTGLVVGRLTNRVGIAWSAFENCTALKNLVFEGEVSEIDTWDSLRYQGCFASSGLTNLVFKKNVGTIRQQSFLNTRQLRTLFFEGDVGSVGRETFSGCDELKDVYFLGQLERLEDRAFSGLKQMRTLVLPKELAYIGDLAFENCVILTEVIFLGDTPPERGGAIFRGCPTTLKVKYPQGAVGWASFPNYGNRPTESTPTVAAISNFPSASPIRLGQPLANSRLTGGTANVAGKFEFENTNTVPPGGISSQPVLFRPDLWYLDELKFDVQVQVLTNIPQVTVPASLIASVGRRFSLVVQASDGPNTFTQTGLPSGLALGAATGEIQGIPEEVGTHVVEISASNASTYAGLATFELKVGRGTPEIGNAPTASVIRAGQPLAASRLGGGIATNDLGVLPGKFSWLVADRRPPAGTSWQKVKFTPLDLTNHQPTVVSIPVTVWGITSDLATMTLTNGVALSVPYALQANVAGARFQATGLPPGLKLDPQTGTLSGRPTRTGTYTATFTALPPGEERMAAQKSFMVVPRTVATYLQQALSFLQPVTSIP
jgi:hypothetical protein